MEQTDPATTNSLEETTALLDAFFAAVSFEPGGHPDYGAIRDVFIHDGLLIKNSASVPEICTIDSFIAPRQRLVDSGALTAFWEGEIAGATEIFGNIAHRFSTYDKHGTVDGTVTATLGMISTQFIKTPLGWRISSMAWDDERAGLTVPLRSGPSVICRESVAPFGYRSLRRRSRRAPRSTASTISAVPPAQGPMLR